MPRGARALALTILLAGQSACGRGAPAPAPAPEAAPAGTTATAAAAPPGAAPVVATTVGTTSPAGVAATLTTAAVPAASPARNSSPLPSAATVLRDASAVEPGARRALAPGAEAVVHPASSFEVELSVRAPDARLVLLDGHDDQVAAEGVRELSPSRTRLTLAPSAPLVPGSRYALRLDGATDRDLHDDAGRGFAGLSLPLLVAGTPPPPAAKAPARKRRRR